MKRYRGIALITCVALMGLLSSGLLTLALLAKQDVVRTRHVTDDAQLRQVLMAVAAQADVAMRTGATLPTEWSVPTELDVKVETFWREHTDARRVLAIEATWPRSLARQVVTWERVDGAWVVTAAVLERGA